MSRSNTQAPRKKRAQVLIKPPLIKTASKTNKKVLVALSGGIDSAVSAVLLLRAGFQVEAAFMKNWSSTTGLVRNECPWLDDRREALKVAACLGIPLHTFNFEKEYQQKVMQYFFDEYAAGRTPNPDVMCNKEIKFKLLYDKAMQMGFDFLATGHYAQTKSGAAVTKSKPSKKNRIATGRWQLVRSKDEFKDQTYFIYNIRAEQLPYILFPIGKFKKNQVREMARKFNLPNAERKESMGLCFVGKIQLDKFLAQKIKPHPGKIVDTDGVLLGMHKGISFYTLGQREGLGVGGTGPYYVVRKELAANTLVVSRNSKDEQLMYKEIRVSGMHWISKPAKFSYACKVRFRHQQELQDAKIEIVGPKQGEAEEYRIIFAKPQRAVASGQSLVLYKGAVCLGGGVII